ncbi:MAG: DUF433 domain-containing protein [Actinomycetota bacterium]|nr:DUF433 domain-containing protein [Actinomycetota bacterium]
MIERIYIDPETCGGRPCIKGTRIPVYVILDLLAANFSPSGIVKAYPDLTVEDIKAAVEYAAFITKERSIRLRVG